MFLTLNHICPNNFLEDKLNGFSHFRPGSPLINVKILSKGIISGVKFIFFFGVFGLLLLDLVFEE